MGKRLTSAILIELRPIVNKYFGTLGVEVVLRIGLDLPLVVTGTYTELFTCIIQVPISWEGLDGVIINDMVYITE